MAIYLGNTKVNAAAGTPVTASITVDQSYDATSTNAQSGTAVAEAIADLDATISSTGGFKGTVSYEGDIMSLSNGKAGWYGVIDRAGRYFDLTCEPGDVVLCIRDYDPTAPTGSSYDDFTVVQNNIDTITTSDIDRIIPQPGPADGDRPTPDGDRPTPTP